VKDPKPTAESSRGRGRPPKVLQNSPAPIVSATLTNSSIPEVLPPPQETTIEASGPKADKKQKSIEKGTPKSNPK